MCCVYNTWLAVYLTRARAVNEYAYCTCMAALHSSAVQAAMPIYQTLLPFLPFPNFDEACVEGLGTRLTTGYMQANGTDSI